jgi:hypothetical protein
MDMSVCNKMWTYGQERHNAMQNVPGDDNGNQQLNELMAAK